MRTLRPFVTRCARLREYVCVCARHGCCSCVADNPPLASPLLPTSPSAGVTRYQIECSHPPRSRSLKSRAATPEDHPPRPHYSNSPGATPPRPTAAPFAGRGHFLFLLRPFAFGCGPPSVCWKEPHHPNFFLGKGAVAAKKKEKKKKEGSSRRGLFFIMDYLPLLHFLKNRLWFINGKGKLLLLLLSLSLRWSWLV